MKSVFLALGLCTFTLAAQAMPSIGDKAVYHGTYNSQPSYQEMTLTEFDSKTQKFHKVTTFKIGNNAPQSFGEWKSKDELITDEMAQYHVVHCTEQGGVPETVTVPAGTFATCRMKVDRDRQSGFVNIGAVPFGFVSINVVSNGTPIIGTLTTYTRGR